MLDEFYRLYAISLRRLGSPPHAKSFFQALLKEFGDRFIVQLVYHEGRAIAGVVSFRYQNEILPYWAGIDVRYNHTNASNFVYYSLMEHAVGLGIEIFDFGRTRVDNEGGCRFKIHQGFDPLPLTYSTYSPAGTPPPGPSPQQSQIRNRTSCLEKAAVGRGDVIGKNRNALAALSDHRRSTNRESCRNNIQKTSKSRLNAPDSN